MKSDSWLHCLEGGLFKKARRMCQEEGAWKSLALRKASEQCSQKPVGSHSGLFAAPMMMGLNQEDELDTMFCSEGKALSNCVCLGVVNTWVMCACESHWWGSSCHLQRGLSWFCDPEEAQTPVSHMADFRIHSPRLMSNGDLASFSVRVDCQSSLSGWVLLLLWHISVCIYV